MAELLYPVAEVSKPQLFASAVVAATHGGAYLGATELRLARVTRRYYTGDLGSGTGTVHGTTENKDTPANTMLRARVRLIRERDGMVIREMWSDVTTGTWRFDCVDELEVYTALTYHPARDHRAVVADGLVPEVMP